jgi:hypothetical protein
MAAGHHDTDRRDSFPPAIETVGVLVMAIVATMMALPAFVQSFSWSGTPEGPGPTGGVDGWLIMSIFVGVPALLLSLVALNHERGSTGGRILAGLALGVAIVGSCIGGWALLVAASAGL